ncbi:YggT family protein [Porticoccaceae bacterium]|jgi:YggT family protein|nr:YggT family protein [Porticoccaceae bacterium]
MNALGGTPIYLLSLAVQIYSFILLIRLLLQLVQADFFNPISQTMFKLSAPVVTPLSKLFPTIGTLNLAVLAAAILVKWLFYLVMGLATGVGLLEIVLYIPIAAFDLLYALIEIYFWGIFILAISSWVGTTNHPSVQLVGQITEPYLRPFRKVIPPIGMMDISPMVAILSLMVIRNKLLPILGGMVQSLVS